MYIKKIKILISSPDNRKKKMDYIKDPKGLSCKDKLQSLKSSYYLQRGLEILVSQYTRIKVQS